MELRKNNNNNDNNSNKHSLVTLVYLLRHAKCECFGGKNKYVNFINESHQQLSYHDHFEDHVFYIPPRLVYMFSLFCFTLF